MLAVVVVVVSKDQLELLVVLELVEMVDLELDQHLVVMQSVILVLHFQEAVAVAAEMLLAVLHMLVLALVHQE
jgi:hypothetical protein